MDTKVCSKCKFPKPIGEFHKNRSKKDGLGSYCSLCWPAIAKEQYQTNKQYYKDKAIIWKGSRREELLKLVLETKSVPCADCGVPYPHYILEFDHVRGVKVSEISVMIVNSCSVEALKEEINKCDVVCANCHKTRHHLMRQKKVAGYLGRRVHKGRPKKGSWPDKNRLQELVLSMPALEVAKLVGVSSVAIKKMCSKLGLETRPRGYWAKTRSKVLIP